jgi:SOUL heme-binding protein
LAVTGESGRSEAFKLLPAYIAGANHTSAFGNDRIAMTVPVEVSDKERLAATAPFMSVQSIATMS